MRALAAYIGFLASLSTVGIGLVMLCAPAYYNRIWGRIVFKWTVPAEREKPAIGSKMTIRIAGIVLAMGGSLFVWASYRATRTASVSLPPTPYVSVPAAPVGGNWFQLLVGIVLLVMGVIGFLDTDLFLRSIHRALSRGRLLREDALPSLRLAGRLVASICLLGAVLAVRGWLSRFR